MRSLFIMALGIILNTAMLAQGGKAEPQRIQFEPGRSSAKLSTTLSNGQEMEYIFAASKGQSVTVMNSNTKLFDFRLFSDEADVETEFDSSRILTLKLPQTGDYLLFIRKKQVGSPRRSRFSVRLTIK